jgi:hypothetical protein
MPKHGPRYIPTSKMLPPTFTAPLLPNCCALQYTLESLSLKILKIPPYKVGAEDHITGGVGIFLVLKGWIWKAFLTVQQLDILYIQYVIMSFTLQNDEICGLSFRKMY